MESEHDNLLPLPEGQYYHRQLLGLRVLTAGGEPLGVIKEILPGTGNDNYIVEGPRGRILIPAIEDVIQSVDVDKGEMVIEPIKGLLELNEKKPPE